MTVPALAASDFSGGGDAAKPLLVLGPSLGTACTPLWSMCATYLTGAFHVVGWDLPGHGNSAPATDAFSIPDLATAVIGVAERVQQDRGDDGAPFFYAGVSVGGTVGLQLMLDHADRIRAGAVICSGAKIGESQGWQDRAETVRSAGTPTQVVGSAQRWFGPDFIARNPTVATPLLHSLQNADRFSYAWVSQALADFDVRLQLGEIAVPTLAVAGAFDVVTPLTNAQEIADGVQEGSAVELGNVAHLAPVEDPEGTARLLLDFFGTRI